MASRASSALVGAVRHASAVPAAAAAPAAAAVVRPAVSAGSSANNVAESLAGNGMLHRLLRPTGSGPIIHQAVLPPIAAAKSAWKPTSARVGLLGYKAGMTADWDKWGVRRALTVVQFDDVIVTGVRTQEKHGYTALQVGCRVPKTGKLKAAYEGQFRAEGLAPRADVAEFRVTPDAILPVGTPLTCRHFVPGQRVRVTGVSQGKGFQGAMKRHNFSGQSASHGNSLSHRALGATGCRQDPGRVIKGKKMAGHMGEETITSDGVVVYKIDVKRNLLYLSGPAPGKPGTLLAVKDSYLHPFKPEAPPPFPTYALTDADRLALAKWAAGAYLGPEEEAYLAQRNLLPQGYEREPPFEFVAPPPEVDPFAIPENDDAEEVA